MCKSARTPDGTVFEARRQKAEQGDASAQFNLGSMYREGDGVPQDYLIAHMWYNIVGANGFEPAKESRDSLAETMAPLDISKAQEMARVCVKSKYENCG